MQLLKDLVVHKLYHYAMVRNNIATNVNVNPYFIISHLVSLLSYSSYNFKGEPQNSEHI